MDLPSETLSSFSIFYNYNNNNCLKKKKGSGSEP